MKKLMILVASLFTIVLVWAFAPQTEKANPKKAALETKWFRYVSGTATQPGSYEVMTQEPDCEGETSLCAILVESDGGSPERPTQAGLDALIIPSANFTQPVANVVLFED